MLNLKNLKTLEEIFQIVLFIVLCLSFIIFLFKLSIHKASEHKFATWQFPMLMALFFDTFLP